jgi:hypothetical protein
MTKQTELENKLKGWVHEATVDVLGLWQLCRSAHRDWGASTPDEVKSLVLAFVRELLARGVKAVNIKDQEPWSDQDCERVLERISKEWDALGREPNVPDIVWFRFRQK